MIKHSVQAIQARASGGRTFKIPASGQRRLTAPSPLRAWSLGPEPFQALITHPSHHSAYRTSCLGNQCLLIQFYFLHVHFSCFLQATPLWLGTTPLHLTLDHVPQKQEWNSFLVLLFIKLYLRDGYTNFWTLPLDFLANCGMGIQFSPPPQIQELFEKI